MRILDKDAVLQELRSNRVAYNNLVERRMTKVISAEYFGEHEKLLSKKGYELRLLFNSPRWPAKMIAKYKKFFKSVDGEETVWKFE